MANKKIIDFSSLSELRGNMSGKRIVHCHGVFDILHAGHLAYFESAKKFGDVLVVTLTADEYVNKGPDRPYFNASIRANMLAALEVVDFVAISNRPTAVPAIEALKPHFYVKGPDYRDKLKDPTGAIFLEENAAKQNDGQLVFTGDETLSSSSLLNMFFSSWNDEQQAIIEAIKREGGMSLVERALDALSAESVFVVGEPIVDTYVFCHAEAISSKSPSVSAAYLYEENYPGGSLAIANHLCDFVKNVTIQIAHGDEPYFREILKKNVDKRIRVESEIITQVPTPRKTRFIANDKIQRIFELTQVQPKIWNHISPISFCKKVISLSSAASCTIVADFGHGLFEGAALQALSDIRGFIGLNVQTNSSNLGYNPFTKHKHFSYLSLDLREAAIAYQDRFSSPLDFVRRIQQDFANRNISFSMTLGPNGSYYMPARANQEIKAPAFANSIVDAVGAGDAFFALTALLVKTGCPPVLVPFLGNIFAGLKAKIIGNKLPVTRAQLVKAASAILK